MKSSRLLSFFLVVGSVAASAAQSAPQPASNAHPTVTALLRERTNAIQWFGATPAAEQYGYQDSLLRLSVSQRIRSIDYMMELGQSAELALPTDAISPVAAQGQLGLGGIYYGSNGNNNYPAAASLRQAFVRYHSRSESATFRLGRFEFGDGQEMTPRDTSLLWLQTNRMAQRLVGSFGFSNGQRSFDGVDLKLHGASWDVTSMAGRATQGVFNMNANPELNVDIQYLAYTRSLAHGHVMARGFALGYHDGRTGLTKTDNRPAAVRAHDHKNIRIGTYGGDVIATVPAGKATLDFLAWGALQNGAWGLLDHSAGAVAVEGGVRFNSVASKPWLRGGMLRTTGDNNSADGTHNTFFQVLPTPRAYARFPFFNMMNSKDEFVQVIDRPTAKLELRGDLHFLQLTSAKDFWYQGGGAFDNKVFGYTGRPGSSSGSFGSLADLSADYALSKQVALTAYYAHVFGKTVIATTYPTHRDANYAYFELTYRFQKPL